MHKTPVGGFFLVTLQGLFISCPQAANTPNKPHQNQTMKKTFFSVIISASIATSAVFGQHQQTMTFTGPSEWTPGTTVTLDAFLTFSGYNSLGVSYWLEVPNALAPFIEITNVQYFTFPNPNQPPTYPILFNSVTGSSGGYMCETTDLGDSIAGPPKFVPPGSYHINTITFSLAAGAPIGAYSMLTTSHNPRISEVADNDFNDNNINPPGMFGINVVPEPSVPALLSFAVVGAGVLVYRRRRD